jgi:hypothetical protein
MAGRSEDQTMQYVDKWFDLTLFVLGPLQGRTVVRIRNEVAKIQNFKV